MSYIKQIGNNDMSLNGYDKVVPIFLTVSNEYFKYFGVLLQSIINHSSNLCFFDVIVIVDEKIANDNYDKMAIILSKINNFRVRFYEINDLALGWKPYLRASYKINSYYRLLAPYFILEYDKAIYLDVDMIVNEDISKLYDIEIKEAYLGATKDTAGQGYYKLGKRKELLDDFTNIIGLDDISDYFQAAVLIVNLKKFRENFSVSRIKEICSEKPWMFIDQDVYNFIAGKEVLFLDLKWNVTAKTVVGEGLENAPSELYNLYEEARKTPYIIHFPGEKKPWFLPNSDLAYYFWLEARKNVFYEEILIECHKYQHLIQSSSKQNEMIKCSNPVKQNITNNEKTEPRKIIKTSGDLLFRCATLYHLFNAINIRVQLYPKRKSHVILTGDTNWGNIPKQLLASKVFNSIFCSKTKKRSDLFEKMTKEIRYCSVKNPEDYFVKTEGDLEELNFISSIGYISDFFVAMSNFHEKYLYYYLVKNNPQEPIQIHIFEEGSASYVLNYENGNTFDCLDHKFYKQRAYPNNICEVMVYEPLILSHKSELFRSSIIPKIDKNSKVLKKILLSIFGKIKLPKEKFIFFDSPDIAENYLSNGIDILDKFSKIVGKENIIVKIHPRNIQDKYSLRGYKVMPENSNLWEMCCFDEGVREKIFLSEFSTASMTANTIFQIPIISVNFYRMLLQPKKSFLFSKPYFESFYRAYCNFENKEQVKIFTPESEDELISIAHYLKGLR